MWILLKQETVASAGPYARLHLTPDREPRQHPTTQFFTGRMPFLPPNQQRQSTEDTVHINNSLTEPSGPTVFFHITSLANIHFTESASTLVNVQ